MELQTKQRTPQSILLLQQNIIQSRIFKVFSLEDALQKMLKIYGQAMTLKNSGNPQVQQTVRFSLKAMIQYYSSMQNIMFMQKDNKSNPNQQQKHKRLMQTYDKEFVLASLKNYCVKRSTERSIQLAKLIYMNGENVEDVIKNIGFA